MNGIKEKFLSNDVKNLVTKSDVLIITETHFGVRHKVPDKFEFVARSKPLPSKNLRGGVIVYKKAESPLKLNVICDNLNDLIILEIEGSSAVIVATYIPPGNSTFYSDSYFDTLELIIQTFIKYRTLFVVGDINARIANRFPTNGIKYKLNPDAIVNAHGGKLTNILKNYNMYVLNGVNDGGKSFDSKFTFIRKSGASQVDLALCNDLNCIQNMRICDKIPQSDHCALYIDIYIQVSPSFEVISDCACGINSYNQYDLSKRIRSPINIKKLNLLTLQDHLIHLGDNIHEKYNTMVPSQTSINQFANDLTNGVYECCKNSKIHNMPNTRIPEQHNCTSENFSAIAEAHRYRFENIHGDKVSADYHRQEWLFYQSIAWEKEEEELYTTKNKQWKIYSTDPKKLWKMIDYKGEVQSGTSCPPKIIRNYFSDSIFKSPKITGNPILSEIKHEIEEYENTNEITDKELCSEELSLAIRKYGNGVSFDGLSGSILSLLPANLRNVVLHLYQLIFHTFYPSPWQSQLLSPIEKKGHSLIQPKLRGIAVGPMFSRLYDIIVNFRFEDWYHPNPEQAGGRKEQGCPLQIFGLFIMLDMAKHCGKKVFIGLLDFEKAFDYMNRPTLMRDMMKDGIGSTFLKNLNNMYSEIRYLPKISSHLMDDPIISEHGVTQGRTSSGNIFSYYISDMNEPMEDKGYVDFMLANLLQLADDSIVLADHVHSLSNKLVDVFGYCEEKFTVVNMDKTNYMEFSEKPKLECIEVGNRTIKPVDPKRGYVWLGFHLSYNSEIHKLVEHNLKKKKSNEAKFYAWLAINHTTPFPIKLQVLYACLFQAILYSCETWGDISPFQEELLIIEKKALRAILGVKKSTPDDILYIELNREDIITSIHQRQYNFFRKFLQLPLDNSTTRTIWERYKEWDDTTPKPYYTYYSSLSDTSKGNKIDEKKNTVLESDKSMHERYRSLIGLEYCTILYSSIVNDQQRSILTRWRLSCHPLFVERGRYARPKPPRAERTCMICMVMEDEEHALFICRAHCTIRYQHRGLLLEYRTVKEILNPRSTEDIVRISKYLEEIENNMDDLGMKR